MKNGVEISFILNGRKVQCNIKPSLLLIDLLRNELKLKSILISKLLTIREELVKVEKEYNKLEKENEELKQNEMEIKHTFYNCTFTDSNINL